MGAGKTTVGRKLAHLLNRDFIDTDHELERRTGVSVGHIFEVEGESGFRTRESRLLEEIAARTGCIVSTGGGMILAEANRRLMQSSGMSIYLDAEPAVLWKRVRHNKTRPLLNTDNPKWRLAELHTARDGLYRSHADIIITVSRHSAEKTARRILQTLTRCASGNSVN